MYRAASVYLSQQEYDCAIADFTKALDLNPDNVDAYKYRGLVYQSKGELDRTIADFTQAIELNPDDANAYCWRGDAYQSKGDYDCTSLLKTLPKQ